MSFEKMETIGMSTSTLSPFNIDKSLSNQTIRNKFKRQKDQNIPCDNSPVFTAFTPNDTTQL